jgi:transcriptional regulator with XRE-family HTH domain
MTTRATKSVTRQKLEALAGGPLTLGMLMRSIREGEEWSLADMGVKLGVTRAFVANIENGKAVAPESAARYAKLLGYSEEQFVRLALQDQVARAGLDYEVQIAHAGRRPRARAR